MTTCKRNNCPDLKLAAIEALDCVTEDINLLESGDWQPDGDSCQATLDNLEIIRAYLTQGN